MSSLTRTVIKDAGSIRLKSNPRTVIIGAGVSGITMAHNLRQAGIDNFTIYEKAGSIGGTWRENTYPGIACDVSSYLYSFTFYPNPHWSQSAAPGAEIRDYIEKAAKDLDLFRHIRFNTEVTECTYKDGAWTLKLSDGSTVTADIVISCAGFLHHPHMPKIKGLEDFKGEVFHSARWNHGVDLTGKRVGNIGTGSTSTQIVSAIVDKVKSLTVFQRTAQWVLPLPREVFTAEQKAALAKNPEKLLELYDEQLTGLHSTYGSVSVGDKEQTANFIQACNDFLGTVKDPELRKKLTPQYEIMCKRLVMSADFYDAVQHKNCEIVTTPIERVEATGVRTADGKLYPLDVLILATGYRAREFFRSIRPTGEDGVTLDDAWAKGVSSFETVALAKFPNFFMLGGPHSTVGNQSFITCAELQAAYILRLLKLREDNGAKAIVPKDDAEVRFCNENAAAGKSTPWLSGCSNWYLEDTDNFPFWSRHPDAFVELMAKGPQIGDYRLLR